MKLQFKAVSHQMTVPPLQKVIQSVWKKSATARLSWHNSIFSLSCAGKSSPVVWRVFRLSSWLAKIFIHGLARLLPTFSFCFLNFSKCTSVGLQARVSCLWGPQVKQTMQDSINLMFSLTSGVELNNSFLVLS